MCELIKCQIIHPFDQPKFESEVDSSLPELEAICSSSELLREIDHSEEMKRQMSDQPIQVTAGSYVV